APVHHVFRTHDGVECPGGPGNRIQHQVDDVPLETGVECEPDACGLQALERFRGSRERDVRRGPEPGLQGQREGVVRPGSDGRREVLAGDQPMEDIALRGPTPVVELVGREHDPALVQGDREAPHHLSAVADSGAGEIEDHETGSHGGYWRDCNSSNTECPLRKAWVRRITVVGAGAAGTMAAIFAATAGAEVTL